MSTDIRLTGLDAANPGAFLATLGIMDVLQAAGVSVQLRWTAWAGWRPEVRGMASKEALVELIAADLRGDRNTRVYGFTYARESGSKAGDPVGDLKPHPHDLREGLLAPLRNDATRWDRSAVDACAGLVAEGGVDNNGKSKPTAFHFTAGNQLFLVMASELRRNVTEDQIAEGLFGPWTNPAPLPTLGWDVGNSREYALRATNPSTDKKVCQPAVEWLGLLGLRFFPCFAERGQTRTTGVSGSWKKGEFIWPVWQGWLAPATVASVVALDLQAMSAAERRTRGIATVYASAIHRHDQGGYGSFRPPRVLL
jgi:hypothetical protein